MSTTILFLLLFFNTPHKIDDEIKEPNYCTVYNDSEKSMCTVETKEESPIKLRFETRVVLETKLNHFYIYGYCSAHKEWLLIAYQDGFTGHYFYNPKYIK